MRAMGGLRKKMPITSITMLIGALAIAGIPPLSGFWSKDEVLAAVYNAGSFDWMFFVLWAMGVATAFMTAFYMFRMWFMTFGGEPRSEVHAHESGLQWCPDSPCSSGKASKPSSASLSEGLW
jgi:NADH:ubiquinone oxidoreductase subunit 5 (subunit L)/multisubunit Na+/H+ antiporter MnhA subunit